jgi:dTDP-glucose pyrophosphorylase
MLRLPEEELAKIASTVQAGSSVRDAVILLTQPACRGLVVVDRNDRPMGVVQLLDVRRAALAGAKLESFVETVMRPIDGYGSARDEIARLLGISRNIRGTERKSPSPHVVILAGGEGRRLRPLTSAVPKPLLPIGGTPLLEITMRRLGAFGLNSVTVAILYLGEMIESYFGTGDAVGMNIRYVREEVPLGTAGGIRLAMAEANRKTLAINGDVLTALHYGELLAHHDREGNALTVAVKVMEVSIPYGVLELDGLDVLAVREKPVKRYPVSAGIYVLEPEVVDLIPHNRRFDMTDVIATAVAKGHRVGAFPIVEYWQDIGRVDDYKSANLAYADHFTPRGQVESSWGELEA